MSDLASIRDSAAAGQPLTHEQLRTWARARHHFDATREQEAVGHAVLHLLDQLTALAKTARCDCVHDAGPSPHERLVRCLRCEVLEAP